MILLVFVAAVLVSVVLERQARRHRLQRAFEYERIGIPMPAPRPKLKRTEAWLNIWLGLLLVALSVLTALSALLSLNLAERYPDHASVLTDGLVHQVESGAFFLAGGIALAWLGWKAIREIARHESGADHRRGP